MFHDFYNYISVNNFSQIGNSEFHITFWGLLYYGIRRRCKIPHNKIHFYLKETGRTIPNPKKQKKV